MVATLPPSVPGLQAQLQLRRYFQQSGGVYMLGDTAVCYEAEGGRITEDFYTADHGDHRLRGRQLRARHGQLFQSGVGGRMDGVREPLFGLDVAYAADRGAWYDRDLFAAQPFELFGVKCDEHLRGLRDGRAVENLYAIGAGLAGFNPVKEGCGAGVFDAHGAGRRRTDFKTSKVMMTEYSENNFEQCIKCTVCTAHCPAAAANPLFLGRSRRGPTANACA